MSDELLSQGSLEDTRTPEELDKLVEQSETARNSERPMSAAKEKAPEVKEETTYEFTHNGRPVKATKEQLIKWAQQGYDYPQKAQKLNQQKAEWDKARSEWEKSWGVYKEIDAYAAQNKQWWDFIQAQWQNRNNPQAAGQAQPNQPAQNDPYASKFQTLEQKLSQFEQFANQIAQKEQLVQQQQEDAALDSEIQSMREKYKHLDWDSLDENGKHLEMRILEHAQANGIPRFQTALRDLLHDELLSKAEGQGKLAVAKGIQAKTKLGVLGESPTPQKGMPDRVRDIKKTSYEDLEADIREELRRGAYR